SVRFNHAAYSFGRGTSRGASPTCRDLREPRQEGRGPACLLAAGVDAYGWRRFVLRRSPSDKLSEARLLLDVGLRFRHKVCRFDRSSRRERKSLIPKEQSG